MASAKLERKYLGHQLVILGLILAPLVLLGHTAYKSFYTVPAELLARDDVWWTTEPEIRPVLQVITPDLRPASATLDLACSSAQGRKFEVELVVGKNGKYVDGRVMGISDPDLRRCILRSLEEGDYQPARYRGRPVAGLVKLRWDVASSCYR